MTAPHPTRAARPQGTRGWVIGRVSGAPIILSPTWFVAAVVLTLMFAQTMTQVAPGLRGYLIAFAFVLLLFVSVLCHEVAHAVVARWRGHQVTELALTLMGGHTAYTDGSTRPMDGILVAVVGPLTNIVLAVGFWAVYLTQERGTVVWLLLYAAAFSNAFVGVFNLLPGLPLDGGQILESIVWAITGKREQGIVTAAWAGRIVAVAVVLWALWPLIASGQQLQLSTAAWAGIIAFFLWSGAGQALRSGKTRVAIGNLRVRDLAVPVALVPLRVSVADAGDAAAPGTAVVLTDDDGRPVAVVNEEAAASVPADYAATTPVTAVAVGIAPTPLDLDLAGQQLLTALADVGDDIAWVLVTHQGSVVGALETRRVIAALQSAMGKAPRRP